MGTETAKISALNTVEMVANYKRPMYSPTYPVAKHRCLLHLVVTTDSSFMTFNSSRTFLKAPRLTDLLPEERMISLFLYMA